MVVNSWTYCDGGKQPKGTRWLGFAGRWFKYRKLGDTLWRYTNNMGGGGEVPAAWRELMPDNAEFENVKRVDFPDNPDGSKPLYTTTWDVGMLAKELDLDGDGAKRGLSGLPFSNDLKEEE